jgi:hypothetical protein
MTEQAEAGDRIEFGQPKENVDKKKALGRLQRKPPRHAVDCSLETYFRPRCRISQNV